MRLDLACSENGGCNRIHVSGAAASISPIQECRQDVAPEQTLLLKARYGVCICLARLTPCGSKKQEFQLRTDDVILG
jgi:hypothetical protein